MTKVPFVAPTFDSKAFNCPFCNAYSNQRWERLIVNGSYLFDTWIAYCSHCNLYSIWHEEKMIYPSYSGIEIPCKDLSEEIKLDYLEAATIVQISPRGAAALLRLAIQKLCKELGEKGADLNSDIGNLVQKGLSVKVQQSLDALRVIGNESVHPGQLNMQDDVQTATALFQLVNFIGEKMISEP